ncbi:MAG: phosphoadenosine phosphosulfate reductase family protein [Anaerolineales bacterium]|nr:phosphoadenosine phosphosulfate reductase family protein [Anaerolineales bacterium]
MKTNNQIQNQTEIQELIAQGAIFFVGHSGGKDSQAMFAILSKIVPADQLLVTHADLGEVEHEGVIDFIRSNIDDKDLLVAQAIHADGTKKDFFSAIRARRVSLDSKGKIDAPAFPSSAARFCTSDLKTGPIWKVIRAAGDFPIVVNCVGIRAEESAARSKKIAQRGTLNVNTKNTNSKRQAFDYWPIADWTIAQVWAEIEEKGQARHPAYDAGNDRLSCAFCIFGSRGDLARAADARPELLKKLTDLESDVRGTMFDGESLAARCNATEGGHS